MQQHFYDNQLRRFITHDKNDERIFLQGQFRKHKCSACDVW